MPRWYHWILSYCRANHPLKKLRTVGFPIDTYTRVYVEVEAVGSGYKQSKVAKLGAYTDKKFNHFG